MASRLDDLVALYTLHGSRFYGDEPVSQLEHALQCAQLAEQAGAPDELVLAALLHDVGHLISAGYGAHEEIGARYLYGIVPESVIQPIRLHVSAKRYLCCSEPSYWDSLSAESKRSLERQGGPFSGAAASYFLTKPFADAAVRLRRWDEGAKVPGHATPQLGYYLDKLEFRDGAQTARVRAPSPI